MRKETAAAQDKAERHFVRLEVLIVEQNKEPHQGARSNKAAAARIDEEQELLGAQRHPTVLSPPLIAISPLALLHPS